MRYYLSLSLKKRIIKEEAQEHEEKNKKSYLSGLRPCYVRAICRADAAQVEEGAFAARSNGLSDFGEKVILEMNRLGMFVDISHVTADAMKDALRVTKAPVIFSHSSARAICSKARNVPDDVLEMMVRKNHPPVPLELEINFFPP